MVGLQCQYVEVKEKKKKRKIQTSQATYIWPLEMEWTIDL